jgi:hypothetical protein
VIVRPKGDERMDINTDAPVITRDEILIAAPIQTIWDVQTDVAAWPSWQPDGAQPDALQPALDASLRGWLENLKREAERRSG